MKNSIDVWENKMAQMITTEAWIDDEGKIHSNEASAWKADAIYWKKRFLEWKNVYEGLFEKVPLRKNIK